MSPLWSKGQHRSGALHDTLGRLAVTPAHIWVLYLTIRFLG